MSDLTEAVYAFMSAPVFVNPVLIDQSARCAKVQTRYGYGEIAVVNECVFLSLNCWESNNKIVGIWCGKDNGWWFNLLSRMAEQAEWDNRRI
jgi:hypothetical protein